MPRIGFGFQVSVLGEELVCSVSSQAVTRGSPCRFAGVGVQQPGHNLGRKYSRRRAGRSSMGTGQALSTFNQFGFDAMRRHMKASSSGSKSTRKWSPGLAGTAAGTVNRRFESRVTIMVGYSYDRSRVSTWAGEQGRSQIADSKFRF